jgi:hypothetical protein
MTRRSNAKLLSLEERVVDQGKLGIKKSLKLNLKHLQSLHGVV